MIATLLLTLSACSAQQDDPAPLFEVSLTPGSELWSEVRYLASLDPEENGEAVPVEPAMAEAVAAARRVGLMLAGEPAWTVLDGQANAVGAGEWLSMKLKLPGRLLGEGTKRKELRSELELLFASLDSAAAPWIEQHWPARQAALLQAATDLQELFNHEAQTAVLLRLKRWVAAPLPPEPVSVRLVTRSVAPGEVTVLVDSLALSLVSVTGRSTLELCDVVLHEAIHALETRPIHPPTLFNRATAWLIQEGVRKPSVQGKYVHTFYYLAAAEAIRGVIDPNHVDHGITGGYYGRATNAYGVIKPLWDEYVAGNIRRGEMLETVAKKAAALMGK